MKTYTESASSLKYAKYGSSSWGSDACQGAYGDTSSSGSRVGVMVFTNAAANLKGKQIKQIDLQITCAKAGSGSSSKVLTFHAANYQYMNTSVKGSGQVGKDLGTLSGKFYGNTVTHTLSLTSNATLFVALSQYLYEGNCALVIYNGEKCSSSQEYSTNYARITAITMTVHYEEDATVWYCNGGQWIRCNVYYCNGGNWIQVTPYYNSGGTWIRT